MPNADIAAIKATLQKVAEDLRWLAKQQTELKRDYERTEANRENLKQLNPNGSVLFCELHRHGLFLFC